MIHDLIVLALAAIGSVVTWAALEGYANDRRRP